MAFLEVNATLLRGPQPDAGDLYTLKARGLRTVVNTREESVASRAFALRHGLNYYHIPVTDWSVPAHHQIQEFLELTDATENRSLLVHCWGGVGRTGIFVCCYRFARLDMEMQAAIDLSDLETPHLQMSHVQRQWLHQWALKNQAP